MVDQCEKCFHVFDDKDELYFHKPKCPAKRLPLCRESLERRLKLSSKKVFTKRRKVSTLERRLKSALEECERLNTENRKLLESIDNKLKEIKNEKKYQTKIQFEKSGI
jgi:regulator of replication initiation timing